MILCMAGSERISPKDTFIRQVEAGLRHRCGVTPGDTVLLAVSGGCDSVALLRAMQVIGSRQGWGLSLRVAHVLHDIRSEEAARADATFVEQLAASFDLPFQCQPVSMPEGENVEAAARQRRYSALHQMALDVGASVVVTAHHADDQLETVLMRLMRGCSIKGLSGMAWRRRLLRGSDIRLIRPMLGTTRTDAADFLKRLEQPWQEDHTNQDTDYMRAAIRHRLVPAMRELSPASPVHAVRLADHVREVSKLIAQTAQEHGKHVILSATENKILLDRQQARQMPVAALSWLLRDQLMALNARTDRLGSRVMQRLVRVVCDSAGGHRTFGFKDTAGKPITVSVTRDQVRVEREEALD